MLDFHLSCKIFSRVDVWDNLNLLYITWFLFVYLFVARSLPKIVFVKLFNFCCVEFWFKTKNYVCQFNNFALFFEKVYVFNSFLIEFCIISRNYFPFKRLCFLLRPLNVQNMLLDLHFLAFAGFAVVECLS